MKHFSKDFKESLIQKSLLSGGPSLAELSRSHNIPLTTIYGWKKKYANTVSMNNSKNWTPEKKLQAIIETSLMKEHELGEYLRKNGLKSSDIEQWKKDSLRSLKDPGRPKKDPELANSIKKNKTLLKDLKRKNKALAEMSARIILLKKSHEIFGVIEEDE